MKAQRRMPVVNHTPPSPILTVRCVYVPRNIFTQPELYANDKYDHTALVNQAADKLPEQYRRDFRARAWVTDKGKVSLTECKGMPSFYNFEKWDEKSPAQLLVSMSDALLVCTKKTLGCPLYEVAFTYRGEETADEVLRAFESEFLYGTEAHSEVPLIQRGLENKLGSFAEGAAWLASRRGG
ncbi:hypothetical protein HY642_03340, partial [Candidatus Woesearchaeota archaeon]|nr:hypothetical protein [Candidatus Woesearchaeota archaeon]